MTDTGAERAGEVTVRAVRADADLVAAWPVVRQLRPHLDEAGYLDAVRRQFDEGFLAAVAERDGRCVGFAGYRCLHLLAHGATLYVDDLVTDEAERGTGVGRALLDWLQRQARERGCRMFSLDSGTQRLEAHAFYFRHGLRATAFHFLKPLD